MNMTKPFFIFLCLTAVTASAFAAETMKLTPDQLQKYKEDQEVLSKPSLEGPVPIEAATKTAQMTLPAMYPNIYEQTMANTLWKAADKAGTLAKSVSHTVSDYLKEKEINRRQQEIVAEFYSQLHSITAPLRLSLKDMKELTGRVEKIYIADGETDQYHLDAVHFRELPQVVKTEYTDMMLPKIKDGRWDTYYLSGKLKTRWEFQNGKPYGAVVTYYENGDILYIDLYDGQQKISRKKYNPEGKLEFEQDYQYEAPRSVGGHQEAAGREQTEKNIQETSAENYPQVEQGDDLTELSREEFEELLYEVS